MMEQWGDSFRFEAWMDSVNERLKSNAEEIATLLLEVAALKEQLATQSFMSPGMVAIVQPRNRSQR